MLSKVAVDDGSVDVSEVHELVSWVNDPPGTWLEWLRMVFTLLSVPLMRLSGSYLMRHTPSEAIREAIREVIREAISGTISGNQKQFGSYQSTPSLPHFLSRTSRSRGSTNLRRMRKPHHVIKTTT